MLTYPHNNPPKDKDGNIIEPRDFFQKHLENLQENPKLKEHIGTLISAYVHMDELKHWQMCSIVLGKICASDHALNAVEEMSALNKV